MLLTIPKRIFIVYEGRNNLSQDLSELKKYIFHELLNITGRVFILVKYSDDVFIGERGFLPEEKEKGLILVFSRQMAFEWSDQGISALLGFGTKSEKCFIPNGNIMSVFSPELNAQFSVHPSVQKFDKKNRTEEKKHATSNEKVIKVNFTSKLKGNAS